MDSDYEKDFPPLPLPRYSPHRQQRIIRKKSSPAPSSITKKKKMCEAAAAATCNGKAVRKMRARKVVQK